MGRPVAGRPGDSQDFRLNRTSHVSSFAISSSRVKVSRSAKITSRSGCPSGNCPRTRSLRGRMETNLTRGPTKVTAHSVAGFRTRPVSAAGRFPRRGSPGCKTPSPRHTDHSARATPRAWDKLRRPRSRMSRTSSSRIPSVVTPATRTNPGLNRPVGVFAASLVSRASDPRSLRGRSA